MDYHNIGQTPIIPLEDFKKLMGVETDQYSEFKRLSSRVIKPSLKELNEVGGYDAKVEYTKENRKVIALKFYFKEIPNPLKVTIANKVVLNQPLQIRLVNDFGLSLRQAQKVLKTYPVPYITESLAIIKIKIAQKIVKNIPAYTVTVLKNDYTPIQHSQKQPIP